jgi:hypothetical protein
MSNSQREIALKLKDLKNKYSKEMIGRFVEIKELDWETNQEYSDARLRECSSKVRCERGIVVSVDVVDGTTEGLTAEDCRHLFDESNTFNPTMDLGRVYVTVQFMQNDGSTERFTFNEYEFIYLDT